MVEPKDAVMNVKEAPAEQRKVAQPSSGAFEASSLWSGQAIPGVSHQGVRHHQAKIARLVDGPVELPHIAHGSLDMKRKEALQHLFRSTELPVRGPRKGRHPRQGEQDVLGTFVTPPALLLGLAETEIHLCEDFPGDQLPVP
jgi:hypothetical protein